MTRYPETSPTGLNSGNGPYLTPELNAIYVHYYNRLLAVATTRYRWLGLGPWVDPMRVEWLLVNHGLAAFTYVRQRLELPDKLYGLGHDNRLEIDCDRFTVTQAAVTGFLDDTYTPAGYQTYAPNGAGGIHFRTTLPLEEWKGVPIWGDANRSRYDAETIALFARRLASASLVVDTNLRATMRGVVVVTSQDKLLGKQITLEGAMRGIDQFVVDEKDVESMKALDFGVHPDTVERSHVIAMRLWAEALEALGVEPPVAEKKERMITDEANGDHSQIAAIRRLTLTPRRRAADLINRRYFSGEPVVEVVDQW
jgi:hypothetical protein